MMIKNVILFLIAIVLVFIPFLTDFYLRFIPTIVFYVVLNACVGLIFQHNNVFSNIWKLFIFFLPSTVATIYWFLGLLGYIPNLTLM